MKKVLTREEAIDHIKWFEEHLNVHEVLEKETRSSDEAYAAINNVEHLKQADLEVARELCKERRFISRWLMRQFNIGLKEIIGLK